MTKQFVFSITSKILHIRNEISDALEFGEPKMKIQFSMYKSAWEKLYKESNEYALMDIGFRSILNRKSDAHST